jgi:hypothetical protein
VVQTLPVGRQVARSIPNQNFRSQLGAAFDLPIRSATPIEAWFSGFIKLIT